MGMKKFRASPMPAPPREYNSQFMLQVIRNLEQYFARLDSQTPIIAEEVEALKFIGDISNTTTQYADVSASIGQAAVSVNTPEVIVLDTPGAVSERIEFDNSELTFSDAGVYKVSIIVNVENTDSNSVPVTLHVEVESNIHTSRTYVVGAGGEKTISLDTIVPVAAGQSVGALFSTTVPAHITLDQAQLICVWVSRS